MNKATTILSTGMYVPSRVLTNQDLEKMVDTSDEWITERTGIKERRIAAPDETSSMMGAEASKQALDQGGLTAEAIDVIICATCTPDTVFPSTACHIQRRIGAHRAYAFDLQAACSGFLYGMEVARGLISNGSVKNVLLVGAEKISGIIDWQDRNTCVLFGDGAGAAILTAGEGRGIASTIIGSDGTQEDILYLKSPPAASPFVPTPKPEKHSCIVMEGRDVYKKAVLAMNESAVACLEKAGVKPEELACVIPHQANLRIIESVAQRLNISLDRFYINLDRYGNMSAACIPIALHEAAASGKIKRGDWILLVAFGGGLTWSSVLLQY